MSQACSRISGLLTILIAATLVGCDGLAVLSGTATLDELRGRWRAEPLVLGAETIAATDRTCRAGPDFPAGTSLVIIDARGQGQLMTAYAGPAAFASCRTEVGRDGEPHGGLTSFNLEPPPVVAGHDLLFIERETTSDWFAVVGRAGPDIVRVGVEDPALGPVSASLHDGWFAVWWPGDPTRGYTVIGYDASGTQVASITGP